MMVMYQADILVHNYVTNVFVGIFLNLLWTVKFESVFQASHNNI